MQRITPRWPGESCIVAATGPSLTDAVAEQCHGSHLIAVNDAYRRLPFADVLYAGDADWWDVHQGCPQFAGEKWSAHEARTAAYAGNEKLDQAARFGLHLVAGKDREGFSFDPARIHYGGNSGFQAINLAVLFGATRILLVGFDMRTTTPRHFFGEHPAPLGSQAKYEHFHSAFHLAARVLPAHTTIINCTPGSALRCFPMMALEAALQRVIA